MTILGIGLITVLVVLLWYWRHQTDPRLQMRKAEKALRDRKVAVAQAQFLRVIALVDTGKIKSADRNELASRAHMAVAEIEQSQGRPHGAVSHYRDAKALGASLPVGAVLLLAECYGEQREAGADAVEAYLTYLSSGPKTGTAAEQVYAALQNLCQITEDMKPALRKPAAELNRRVIAANPKLEWAYYFLGLGSLLDGRASEAIAAFGKARSLNPDRALTFYWLAVCHLQLPAPALDDAIEMIEKFLSFPHGDSKTSAREARVCSEIAKRLIESIGGFSVSEKGLNDRQRANLDRAIHYLEVAVERKPESASNQHDLGQAYRLKGASSKAIAAFRRALNLNPQEKLYAYDLGLECRESGQLTVATQALERAVEISPAYEDAHDLLGEIYFGDGSYEKAVAHLHAAVVSGKRNPRRLGLLVRSLCARGDYGRVAEVLDCRKADPSPLQDDIDAAYAAGRSYSALGRFQEAIAWLKGMNGRPDAKYLMGCAYANLKDFVAAKACFDELAGSSDEWTGRAALQRGHLLFLQGDLDGAEENYRQAAAADPHNCRALRALGELELERENFGDAVAQLSAAVAIDPENGELPLALAVALERKGDLTPALQNYECVSQGSKFPSHHRSADENLALLRIGVIRCRLGDFDGALKALDRAAALGDRSDTLLFYRGLACALLGRCEEAISQWGQLQQHHPQNERLQLNLARARYVLGTQYLSQGKREAAMEQWEKYLCQYPMDENVAQDLGELHFRKALEAIRTETSAGLEQARECLRAALQRAPGNRTYRLYAALCDARSEGGVDGSITVLRNLVEEVGRTPVVLYHLGWCLLQDGKTDEATQLFEEIRANPEANGYGRYASWALANQLIRAGKFVEASEILMSIAVPADVAAKEA